MPSPSLASRCGAKTPDGDRVRKPDRPSASQPAGDPLALARRVERAARMSQSTAAMAATRIPADTKLWADLAAKERKGADPAGLVWHTPEGIELKPLWTAADVADLD